MSYLALHHMLTSHRLCGKEVTALSYSTGDTSYQVSDTMFYQVVQHETSLWILFYRVENYELPGTGTYSDRT